MELKRILARDNKQANEKAVALYGPDVLVISSCQVRGQTELIVAVDIDPLEGEEAIQEETGFSALTPKIDLVSKEVIPDENPSSTQKTGSSFEDILGQNLSQQAASSLVSVAKPNAKTSSNTVSDKAAFEAKMMGMRRKPKAQADKTVQAAKTSEEANSLEDLKVPSIGTTGVNVSEADKSQHERHELLRGQEIVSLVRDELAALRKEFRMTQQMNMWQMGTPTHPAVQSLKQSLQEAPIPAALKALLLDSIHQMDSQENALSEIKNQLLHSIGDVQRALPDSGVHAICGQSGSGKTLTVARLAQQVCTKYGSEEVAIISYQDSKPGAWNQTQLMSSQCGVDSFRATNAASLQLLLEDLSGRRLILIDTSGVQMAERIQELQLCCAQAQMELSLHAVVPADASQATIARLYSICSTQWTSWMISKLDESTQPWALLQFFIEQQLGVSLVSRGERLGDWSSQVDAKEWVDLGLAQLMLSPIQEGSKDLHSAVARASAKIAQLASEGALQMTGTHS
jgi:flagellar biosynthesis GTPase FlhF